jgi:hypothetical protein
VIFWRPI